MATIYSNLQGGYVSDNPLLIGATTVNSTAFQALPAVSGGDELFLTLDPEGANGAPEIVKVTAHTASATSVTVTRAQQSTTAREHPTNTVWVHSLTKADLDAFAADIGTSRITDLAVTEAKLAAGAVTTDKIADVTVTEAKIADASITEAKLHPDVVLGLSPTIDQGYIDYKYRTSNQTGIGSTEVDISTLSITWTATADHYYQIIGEVNVKSTVANDIATLTITDGSNNAVSVGRVQCASTSLGMKVITTVLHLGADASVTRKLRMKRASGTGSLTVESNILQPSSIMVVDLGPAPV